MSDNTEYGVSFVEQSRYTTPVTRELRTDNFVTYEVGDTEEHKNSYFQLLVETYTASTTNKACIDSISNFVYGKGLKIKEEAQEPTPEEQKMPMWQKFLGGFGGMQPPAPAEEPDEEKEELMNTINDLIKASDLRKVVKDRVLFGQAAVKILYNGVTGRKKIKEITHFPIQTLAMEKMKDGEVKAVFYHPRWEEYKKGDKLRKFWLFGQEKRAQEEIFIIKPYSPNFFYFVPPDYSPALDYAYLEMRIAEFQANNVDRDFSVGTVINIPGQDRNEDRREWLDDQIRSKMTGSLGDRIIINRMRKADDKMDIQRLEVSQASQMYEYLAREAQEKIIIAHKGDRKLFNIPTPGEQGLGSNADELKVSQEKLQNTVIYCFQDELVDAFKEMFMVNGIEEDIYFEPLTIISEEVYTQQKYWSRDPQVEEQDDEGYGAAEGKDKKEKA